MAYFRLITGLRGCYADSFTNDVVEAANAAELLALIDDAANFQLSGAEEEDSTYDPCSPEEAEYLFAMYTAPKTPYLPTCAASWQGGQIGVLVSNATADEFNEQGEA